MNAKPTPSERRNAPTPGLRLPSALIGRWRRLVFVVPIGVALLPVGGGAQTAPADISFAMQAVARASSYPAIDAAHASAMSAYRNDLQKFSARDGLAGSLVPPTQPQFRWLSVDGAAVRRIGEGRFRLTTSDCVSKFCTDIDCTVANWPQLQCGDGRERTMSAPDLATVILDGVSFSRSLPERDDSDLTNDLP